MFRLENFINFSNLLKVYKKGQHFDEKSIENLKEKIQ